MGLPSVIAIQKGWIGVLAKLEEVSQRLAALEKATKEPKKEPKKAK